MKKKIITLVMAAAMLCMAACGKSESEMQYLKDFKAEKYVTLGEYKGVEVAVEEPGVTEEELDSYIDYVLMNSPVTTPVTDRAVQSGDIANIDYVGKLDGVAFEGGTAQGYDLAIGSGTFIEGFEDGVIGMEIGETKDVEATFPDPYTNNPDLAGKVAVFTVTVNSISSQEIPELTDEYVESLGSENYTNVEEYRAYLKDLMLEQDKQSYEAEKQSLALEAVEAATEFKKVPSGMVDRMNETLTKNITSYAQAYGYEIGDYVAACYGGTAEDYEATLRQQSELMAQRYVMLQAIADKEGIEITDEELDAAIEEEVAAYGYTSVDEYKEAIDVEAFREYLMTQEVMEMLAENAVAAAQ